MHGAPEAAPRVVSCLCRWATMTSVGTAGQSSPFLPDRSRTPGPGFSTGRTAAPQGTEPHRESPALGSAPNVMMTQAVMCPSAWAQSPRASGSLAVTCMWTGYKAQVSGAATLPLSLAPPAPCPTQGPAQMPGWKRSVQLCTGSPCWVLAFLTPHESLFDTVALGKGGPYNKPSAETGRARLGLWCPGFPGKCSRVFL